MVWLVTLSLPEAPTHMQLAIGSMVSRLQYSWGVSSTEYDAFDCLRSRMNYNDKDKRKAYGNDKRAIKSATHAAQQVVCDLY